MNGESVVLKGYSISWSTIEIQVFFDQSEFGTVHNRNLDTAVWMEPSSVRLTNICG